MTEKIHCQRCGKRLSRKSARIINDEILCSACMWAPPPKRSDPE